MLRYYNSLGNNVIINDFCFIQDIKKAKVANAFFRYRKNIEDELETLF